MAEPFRYYVLLIGCDKYPPNQKSLHGCVNDIDAVERLLYEAPGVGVPPAQIRLKRLAAPHDDAVSTSRYVDQTIMPTRENIIAELQSLAGDEVRSSDRVLIYYSGHGGRGKRASSPGSREYIIAADNRALFDLELNPLIVAIARRTSDLTVVLDCCHAAGATRAYIADPSHGAVRVGANLDHFDQEPDPALVGATPTARGAGAGLLKTPSSDYCAIVACQFDETAQEDTFAGVGTHGFLTYGLLQAVRDLSAAQRGTVCWSYIWPRVLDEIHQAATAAGRVPQHPWVLGEPARRVFGGDWTPRDPGFQIRTNPDGTFTIEAGTVVGFGVDATVGIYKATPARFPEIGSDEDRQAQIGTARIIQAERATCIATAIQPPPNPLPEGARVRMISPVRQERLRVWLDRAEPDPAPVVGQLDLIELVEDRAAAELWVDRTTDGWTLSNDLNKGLARLPLALPAPGSTPEAAVLSTHELLRAGLAAYAHYNVVLRLAKSCYDPGLDQALRVALLDCSNPTLLAEIDPKNPDLPELPRNAAQVHEVSVDHPFCVRVTNTYFKPLYVTVFNCTAGGKVEHLGTIGVNYQDTETVWFNNAHRHPFYACPDNPAIDTIDRIIAIATTRSGADLSQLQTDATIQAIFNNHFRGTRGSPEASELWTATTCLLKIRAQG